MQSVIEEARAQKEAAVMLALVPEELKEKIVDEGIRQGIFPKPDAYLEDGTPVYSSRLIEEFFGVSPVEINYRLQVLNEARQSVGKEPLSFPDDTLVHKVQ